MSFSKSKSKWQKPESEVGGTEFNVVECRFTHTRPQFFPPFLSQMLTNN